MQLPELTVLSENVANQIAAGEVVERPSAVVKELIENSLDAHANRIDIEFHNGGKTFIKVSDNGCGMRKDQAVLCLQRHATSKIKLLDDLQNINTFGFRGEAIPSIASVSKFTLKTITESQQTGTHIDIYGGKINFIKECGIPTGTQISVENLFCTVPARRKFLKSDNTESSHIIKICKLYALSNPNVAFSLLENSKIIFKSERGLNLIDRVSKIFGKDISSKLITIKNSNQYGLSINGCISPQDQNYPTNRNIYAFVNGRPIDSKTVFSSLKEAYKNKLPLGRYPSAFLFIHINPSDVDVNVHPAKREVKFKNEFELRNFILTTIVDKLENFNSIEPNLNTSPLLYDHKQILSAIDKVHSQLYPKKEISQLESIDCDSNLSSSHNNQNPSHASITQLSNNQIISSIAWKYIGNISKKYIIFETQKKSLIILCILSALKRINYEKIVAELKGEKVQRQSLLIPINIEFNRNDAEVFQNNLKGFLACGFDIEEFGNNFYRVIAIPQWIDFSNVELFIRNFVEIASVENFSIQKKSLAEENFAKLTMQAVKNINFDCSEENAFQLLSSLFKCKNSMSSPDGRLICKEITDAELTSTFGS